MLRIKDQTLYISTATEAQDNVRNIPAEWNVTNVLDLVGLLLVGSPNRHMGCHPAQPVLVPGEPEIAARAERQAGGVPMTDTLYGEVKRVAEESGVPFLFG